VALLSLLRLAKITDRKDLQTAADAALKAFHSRLTEMPHALPLMLKAAAFAAREPFRVVIAGDAAAARPLLRAAHRVYQPHRVILGTSGPVEELAREMKPKDGQPAAYVCTGSACLPPATDPAVLRRSLTAKQKAK
jgi:hypothetical protein